MSTPATNTNPTVENPPIASFAEFGLPSFLLEGLQQMKVTIPTPVQSSAIPPALKGLDILASAQTGTGKTIAYLIPLLTTLQNQSHGCALVLAPTRELAAQVKETVRLLIGRQNFNTALLIGGEPMFKQYAALKRHPRIVIGTPGRINDHLSRGTLRLNEAHFLVLDETDRMLDMGFSQALETIARHLPEKRQTFMFSATLPPGIIKLSQNYLNNPQRIAIGSTNQPCAKIKQEMIQTHSSEKFTHLLKSLAEHEGSKIIFVKTKIGADRLADKLQEHEFSVAAIHGDLKQRRRDQVIRQFREERIDILVATDVAARGLDIPHIEVVINFDLPQCPEDYIHRIGRTGRAGREGIAISFISPDEKWKWKAIQNLIHTEGGKEQGHSRGFSDRPPARSKRYSNSNSSPKRYGDDNRTGGSRRFGDDNRSGSAKRFGDENRTGSARRFGDENRAPSTKRFGDENRAPSTKRFGDDSRPSGRRFGDESRTGARRFGDDNRTGGKRFNEESRSPNRFGDETRGSSEKATSSYKPHTKGVKKPYAAGAPSISKKRYYTPAAKTAVSQPKEY